MKGCVSKRRIRVCVVKHGRHLEKGHVCAAIISQASIYIRRVNF